MYYGSKLDYYTMHQARSSKSIVHTQPYAHRNSFFLFIFPHTVINVEFMTS